MLLRGFRDCRGKLLRLVDDRHAFDDGTAKIGFLLVARCSQSRLGP